jgi:hypothetical protein
MKVIDLSGAIFVFSAGIVFLAIAFIAGHYLLKNIISKQVMRINEGMASLEGVVRTIVLTQESLLQYHQEKLELWRDIRGGISRITDQFDHGLNMLNNISSRIDDLGGPLNHIAGQVNQIDALRGPLNHIAGQVGSLERILDDRLQGIQHQLTDTSAQETEQHVEIRELLEAMAREHRRSSTDPIPQESTRQA